MAPGSQRPGPLRTSCLTCRRRHKKCDQRQPTCERCERGDFECLGYGDPPSASVTRSNRRLLPKPAKNEGSSTQVAFSGSPGNESIPIGSSSLRGQSKNIVSAYLPLGSSTSDLNASGKSVVVTESPVSLLRRIVVSHAQRSDPLKTCLDGNWLIETIIAQVEKAMSRWHLKPTNHQKEYFRQEAAQRLRKSKFTCWVSLIGMSVIESFLAGDVSRSRLHNNCIDFMEGSLRHELTLDLVPREIHDRRRDLVHVSLMKTMLVHSSNTYQLLRSLTPAFLQVAYSTPTLWSSDCDFTRIPMMNIMISGCHELAYFVLVDCTYATISGLPQQVEYDTTIHPRARGSHSHQWAQSSPVEMLLALADINACRDESPAARSWKDVEQWLLTWQFPPSEQGATESRMTVTWHAVRESWRLSLLVYLYLAACDASSDDPRIQTGIKQILQLISMIKKQGATDTSVSFLFLQYLMVGICARSEAHRQVVRDKLATADDAKLWLMRTPDLVPVLDHLWHGAAAGGRPIKWGDYMHSRETALPIRL